LRQDDSPRAALHIEHIVPKIHGGTDNPDNLALACIDCNLHKGTNLTGIDPQTNEVTELFHPRRQNWEDHFEWRGIHLIGKTAVGRTTVLRSRHEFRGPDRAARFVIFPNRIAQARARRRAAGMRD
jgi:hypothetical protein